MSLSQETIPLTELSDEYFFGHYLTLFPDYSDGDIITACRNFVQFYTLEGMRTSLEDCRCLLSSLRDCYGERLISPDCFSSPSAESDQKPTDKLKAIAFDGNALVQSSKTEMDVQWYKVMVKRLQDLQPSEIYDTGAVEGSGLMPLSLLDINSLPGSHLVSYIGYILIECIATVLRGDGNITSVTTEKFNSFWNHNIEIPTPPPHALFLCNLKTAFERKSPQGRAVLGPLIWTIKSPPTNNGALMNNILAHLFSQSQNDFTRVLERFQKLGRNFEKINEMNYKYRNNKNMKRLVESASLVSKINDTLLHQDTWKWVHLITDRYLALLSRDNYLLFTLTCCALEVNSQPNDPIWNSEITLLTRDTLGEMNTAMELAKKIRRWKMQNVPASLLDFEFF